MLRVRYNKIRRPPVELVTFEAKLLGIPQLISS